MNRASSPSEESLPVSKMPETQFLQIGLLILLLWNLSYVSLSLPIHDGSSASRLRAIHSRRSNLRKMVFSSGEDSFGSLSSRQLTNDSPKSDFGEKRQKLLYQTEVFLNGNGGGQEMTAYSESPKSESPETGHARVFHGTADGQQSGVNQQRDGSATPSRQWLKIKKPLPSTMSRTSFEQTNQGPVFFEEQTPELREYAESSHSSNDFIADTPITNTPPPTIEDDKRQIIPEEWHAHDVLDVIAADSASVTGFPRHRNQGFEQKAEQESFPTFRERQPTIEPNINLHITAGNKIQSLMYSNSSYNDSSSYHEDYNDNVSPARTQLRTNLTTTTTPSPEWWSAERAQYSFSADQNDMISDLSHGRQESRADGVVKGSYSYSDGYFRRTVHYIADKNGYRIISEQTVPLSKEGPQVDPNGQAFISAKVDGRGYNYVLKGVELPKRQHYQTISVNQDLAR